MEEGEAVEEVGAGEFGGAEDDVVGLDYVDVHFDASVLFALRGASAGAFKVFAECGEFGGVKRGLDFGYHIEVVGQRGVERFRCVDA